MRNTEIRETLYEAGRDDDAFMVHMYLSNPKRSARAERVDIGLYRALRRGDKPSNESNGSG